MRICNIQRFKNSDFYGDWEPYLFENKYLENKHFIKLSQHKIYYKFASIKHQITTFAAGSNTFITILK